VLQYRGRAQVPPAEFGDITHVTDPSAVSPPGREVQDPASVAGERRNLRTIGLAATAAVLVVGTIAAVAASSVLNAPAGSPTALPAPRFADEAIAAGVRHTYNGDFTFFVGGGVAAFDCDADGLPDLYFAGGSERAALFRNGSTPGGTLAFESVPDPVTDLDSVTGAYPIDVDGDRLTDLVVLRVGENVILRGRGDCRFERANEALGLDGGDGWTVGFSATWEGADATLPTLAFGDYLVPGENPQGTTTCADSHLVRPTPGGSTYRTPLLLRPGLCALSMLFSDWDRSGRRDLRVSNDRHYDADSEEQLWRIAPAEPPELYARADGWARLQLFGMGIASQDLTGDGYPEVYLTSQGDNKLQTLADGPARPVFEDIALRRGATAHRPFTGGDIKPSTAWHPAFADVNNDGFSDLYVTKGNVEGQTDHAMKDPSNLLIGQADGSFVEGAMDAGLVDFGRARGAAVVDLNGDGLLDIVTVVRRENVRMWRNLGVGAAAPAHWLGVVLDQDAPNHTAVGSWVAVRIGERTIEHEVTIGGGHASGTLGPMHFGLGRPDRVQVRVRWPDGEVGPWLDVIADRVVRITRGAAAAEPWTPSQSTP
jgi:enediyne biosynthesis protein E4